MAKSAARTRRRNKRARGKEDVKVKSMEVSCNEIAASTTSISQDGEEGIKSVADSCCSTPKGKEYRIPEILSCPPAPKKRRIASNCSVKRSPIAFFASPDIEHFFFCALRNVSA